jgi:hypothetical protein
LSAALGGFLDCRIDLAQPTVEVGNGVGYNLEPGGKSGILHLDRRCSRTTPSYVGDDELVINASRIYHGKAGDEHSEGKSPDQGRHAPSPGEPSCGHELGPFHCRRHHDNGQRCAWEQHDHALDRKESGRSGSGASRDRPALCSSVEPDRNAAAIVRPPINKQFAEMLGHRRCARRGALDLTAQGLQFGHQVQQRPGGKDSVRLLGRRVTQHY